MADVPIIDTHVHFWDSAVVPLSWPSGTAIDRAFLPGDLRAEQSGLPVEAVVFVEADVDAPHHLAEADWVASLAQDEPLIRAIVAHVPLEAEQAEADLEALAAQPLVRAVRRLIQGRDAAALCADPVFRRNLRKLPGCGLHFELCLTQDQLGPVLDLVRSCPDVSFVLDHIAKPAIAQRLREPWWTGIAEMAACPNVTCKLSGVVTEADHAGWSPADIAPYVERVISVFGAERLMFGSDWPVMTLAIGYRAWVELVAEAVPEADHRAVFADNARWLYRI